MQENDEAGGYSQAGIEVNNDGPEGARLILSTRKRDKENQQKYTKAHWSSQRREVGCASKQKSEVKPYQGGNALK